MLPYQLLPLAQGSYSSAQTNTQLIAAPGAGRYVKITSLFVSNGATAGEVKLLAGSGGAVLVDVFLGINSSANLVTENDPIVLPANIGLFLTSTTVTTHSVTVIAHVEDS
jgi:hypothetical protein